MRWCKRLSAQKYCTKPRIVETLTEVLEVGAPIGRQQSPPKSFSYFALLARPKPPIISISTNTVAFHINNIYEKLQVHSKTEAVSKALREKTHLKVTRPTYQFT